MPPIDRRTLRRFAWFVLLAAAWLLLIVAGRGAGTAKAVSYDVFEIALSQGRVERVQATDTLLIGHLWEKEGGYTDLTTVRVDPALAARLDRFKVPYEQVPDSLVGRFIAWIAPTALLVALWYFMMRRTSGSGGLGGLMGVGRSNAKVHVENDTGVTFDDVAGIDEAKAELEEVVQFLRHPQEFGRLGARIPRGVLLVGPPGTGKTMLAKAVAGQAQVPFFSISGSEFVEMFVGVGAARVRDLFEQARQRAPAIVFIDELDALGRARGLGGGWTGNDEKEQTLNQLLTEMDGFDTSAGVVMLAATNRPAILDPALLRAGRFDRQVLIDRPDRTGRNAILAVHARKVRLDPATRLDDVAALTVGFSGADLANLVNEAALAATRRKADFVAREDFVVAIERIVAGLEKRHRVLNAKERERVAWHEMGHALVAIAQHGGDVVRKVSIVPRGVGALGYTLRSPLEDRYLMSRGELEARLAVLMAGRAAEVLVFGDASTGAADDLAKATDIAADMVSRQGMDAALGNVAYERQAMPPFAFGDGGPHAANGASEDTRRRIDEAVRRLLGRAFDDATRLLRTHRADLDRCARALLERETLDEDAILVLAPGLRDLRTDEAVETT
ncbi:MAG TPA: ATP-dependent zinc metalloprotease FtsH [Burkholderiaceae bacterium]